MKSRTGIVLVVVALAALLLVSPAFAGQSGTGSGGGTTAQARVQSGEGAGDQAQQQTVQQTQLRARDCVDSEECLQLKVRIRNELRVGENTEPNGDGRIRERTRTEDASIDTSDTVEPTETIEPTVSPEPDDVTVDALASTDAEVKRMEAEPTGFMAWVRSIFQFFGL